MPAYTFEITWNGGEKISWTYLPTDDGAREFARILARSFKTSDQYRGTAQMTVKNSEGVPITSIEF
jgi:hypothetical protein